MREQFTKTEDDMVKVVSSEQSIAIGKQMAELVRHLAPKERIAAIAYVLGEMAETGGPDESQLLGAYDALTKIPGTNVSP